MSLATIVAAVFEKYADRPAIGSRVKRLEIDHSGHRTVHLEPIYATQTYAQLWARTGYSASWLGHAPGEPVRPGDAVAMLSFTNADYATLDLACIRLGVMTVPLQTGSHLEDLLAILDETQPVVLACSVEQLSVAVICTTRTRSIRRLVVLDMALQGSEDMAAIEQAQVTLRTSGSQVEVSLFHDTLELGRSLPVVELDTRDDCDNALAMLIYTSGSTGLPKGAMYTQQLAAGMWGGSWSTIFSDARAVTFHYMPMSHVAGHSSLKSTLARGGTCCFTAQATLATLIEDIALVKPTELSLVPRVCEMIYQKYQGELARHHAIDGDPRSVQLLETLRMNDMGGHVTWASCSSAPIGAELKDFIERLLGIALHNVYGSTEAGAIWIDNQLLRPPVEDYRLVDVPELGYYLTDRPYPRGELLLKTASIIPGYYKRPELTQDLFDAAGYYRTGDIVAQHGDNELHFVDRRKNVVKLSQGEFVTLSRLETAFAGIPDLDSIFVHANSEWSFPLAVVVPHPRLVTRFAGNEASIRNHLIEAIRDTARTAGLRSFEIPRDLVLATEKFTQYNGLLSDHGKPLWPRLRARYEQPLQALYEHIRTHETERLHAVHQMAETCPPIEVVLQAVCTVLGSPSDAVKPDMQFRDLGGDSLSAVSLSSLLSEALGVPVPVDLIISPVYDLQHIADHVVKARIREIPRPTADKVHGANATVFRAADITLEKFLPATLFEHASAPPRVSIAPRTLLLTGATGFLGRFLALDLLERMKHQGGKLICLVRARTPEAARERLVQAFGSASPALRARFEALSDNLDVVTGDIGEEQLGLDASTWERLTKDVDAIVHTGALVNHLMPYANLFDANVNGTAELIRLAVTHHRKPISFMSSIAVSTLMGTDTSPPLDEEQDIRHWAAKVSAEDTYAAGYGLTKWASEVLLREAHQRFDLPVTVYRSSMILAHRHEPGQLNIPDMFTRLMLSLAATGLAPQTFYATEGPEENSRAHYDGLPVDFTSATIIKTSLEAMPDSYRSFNLVNHHDDGVSLDSVVQWMKTCGVALTIVDDYAHWLQRLEQGLRTLPEPLRAQSILPLLHSLSEPARVQRGSPIPSGHLQAALAQGALEPFEVPRLDKALIARYVDDLRALDLIPPRAVPVDPLSTAAA
jgi:fatty acid CoA ligase FadD9